MHIFFNYRRRLNLSKDEKISTEGILLEYHNLKEANKALSKENQAIENELVTLAMKIREQNEIISKYERLIITNEQSVSNNNSNTKRKNNEKLQSVEGEILYLLFKIYLICLV